MSDELDTGNENNQNLDTGNQNLDNGNQSLLGGDHNQQESSENGKEGGQSVTTIPESIDGYEVNVEGFDFDEFKAIPENQEFLERARAAGMDSKGLNFLLGEYSQLIPNLMQANAALDNEACVSAMTEAWGGDTDQNFGFAKAAANNAIQNGILTAEEVNSPEFGNNPLVLKMAAYFGQQLGEDTPPSNTQQTAPQTLQELIKSEAYLNDKHPDHARAYAQAEKLYAKQNY